MKQSRQETCGLNENDTRTEKRNRQFVEALYSEYHEKLLHYISRHSIDREDVQDVSQETYLKMSRMSDTSSIKHPQAFLFRTALNILRDKFRRQPSTGLPVNVGDEIEKIEGESNITPLRELEAKRELKRFQQALEGLSPNTRNVFLLHRFENMTYAQIAEHCNITVSGVSKHMIKAIAHVAAAMETQ